MIVRAGSPVSFPVLFSSGHPDSSVNFAVLGPSGTTLDSGAIVIPADAVSVIVPVGGAKNALTNGDLVSYRDVMWDYTVAGLTVHGEIRYSIEARVPFGVSDDGVRNKFGVDSSDLPDSEISLVTGYYEFAELVSQPVLTAAAFLGAAAQLRIRNAIEALAALKLLPTMVVRIAAKESNGTNQYQRQKIDWDQLRLALEAEVSAAQIFLVPTFDSTLNFGALLILAKPSVDPFPGG